MWCPHNVPKVRFYFLDKNGWPVDQFYHQPIRNLLRLLVYTRWISTKWVIKDVKWLHGTTTRHIDWEDIDRLAEESNGVRERTNVNPFQYTPIVIPETQSLDLSQKGFATLSRFRILNDHPIRFCDLIGPIDIGDTQDKMKPERE